MRRAAQIIVSVNGLNAASSPLLRSGGEVFAEKSLPLPLGYFRPGLNRIEIQAQLPRIEDASCAPLTAIGAEKRFLFLNSTQIRFPALAGIARMPDLEVMATSAFPFVGGRLRPKLYVPGPDPDSISASATLAARLAASAGQPVNFRFTVTPPARGSGATLVIAPGKSLDDAVAQAVGLARLCCAAVGANARPLRRPRRCQAFQTSLAPGCCCPGR